MDIIQLAHVPLFVTAVAGAMVHKGPDVRRMLLVSWAAVRGTMTLATALAVPLATKAGSPSSERDLVVCLAARAGRSRRP
jgi:NhaP-type Na+/H+ or K+/H+ antiporter